MAGGKLLVKILKLLNERLVTVNFHNEVEQG